MMSTKTTPWKIELVRFHKIAITNVEVIQNIHILGFFFASPRMPFWGPLSKA